MKHQKLMRPGLVDSNSHKTRGNTLTCSSVFKKKKRALEKYSSSFIPCTVQSQEMHFSSDHQTPAIKEWVATLSLSQSGLIQI